MHSHEMKTFFLGFEIGEESAMSILGSGYKRGCRQVLTRPSGNGGEKKYYLAATATRHDARSIDDALARAGGSVQQQWDLLLDIFFRCTGRVRLLPTVSWEYAIKGAFTEAVAERSEAVG
ncbi:MAG: hypothetical protein RLZZ324_224 [Candidatus Parcubacteria bacterium]|jgi:hypothetical protein